MRLLVASFLFAVVSVLPAVAQSNATAGLAGLGAGAALGSTSPNGTTPAPAAGSGAGNTPIEIQIMVFQGMKDIASEIAAITSSYYQGECKAAFDKDPKHQAVTTDRANLKTLTDKLATDSLALRGDRDSSDPNLGRIAAARKLVQEDDAQLAATKALLNIDLNALLDDTKNACSILVEDSTSSNQMALYQAVEGYYNHLQQVDDKVQGYFALQIPPSVTLGLTEGGTVPASDTIAITNASKTPRKVKDITVTGSAAFAVDTTGCDFKTLALNEACDLNVTFPRDGVTVQPDKPYAATVRITSGDPGSDATDTVQTVQLSGTVTAKVAEKPPGGKGPAGKKPGEKLFLAPAPASTAGGGTGSGGSTGGGGGGGSTTPLGLTYLGDLTTALGALKSSITYGATGFQPTAQSFQLLVEAELKAQGIFPYTSTSTLNLQEATNRLSSQFGQMLSWSNDINGWATLCKPPAGGAPSQSGAATNSACTNPDVVASLAVAQQIITGYTSLITSANDGSGSPVIVSVLRGMVLSAKVAEGIPSLQVTVASAGGSTKTNNIFGANLFYAFAPSYNAGVIATFELRDKNNVLIDSGARNSLVAYTKWKSRSFHPRAMKGRGTCDSFCSVK